MEIGTTPNSLKRRERDSRNGGSQWAHLCLSSLLRNVFGVRLVFDKVGPARPKSGIVYPTAFELEAEIRINCEEKRIQPSGGYGWTISRDAATKGRTGSLQELDPSLRGGCDQGGDKLGIPAQMLHRGQKLYRLQHGCRHPV